MDINKTLRFDKNEIDFEIKANDYAHNSYNLTNESKSIQTITNKHKKTAIFTIKVTNPNMYKVSPPFYKLLPDNSKEVEIILRNVEVNLKEMSYKKDKFKILWCYLDDSDSLYNYQNDAVSIELEGVRISKFELQKLKSEYAETKVFQVKIKNNANYQPQSQNTQRPQEKMQTKFTDATYHSAHIHSPANPNLKNTICTEHALSANNGVSGIPNNYNGKYLSIQTNLRKQIEMLESKDKEILLIEEEKSKLESQQLQLRSIKSQEDAEKSSKSGKITEWQYVLVMIISMIMGSFFVGRFK